MAVEMQQPHSEEEANGPLERLCRLCAKVAALRRADQGAQWLRYESEKLKIERKKMALELRKYKDETAARKKAEKAALSATKVGPVTKEALSEAAAMLKLL